MINFVYQLIIILLLPGILINSTCCISGIPQEEDTPIKILKDGEIIPFNRTMLVLIDQSSTPREETLDIVSDGISLTFSILSVIGSLAVFGMFFFEHAWVFGREKEQKANYRRSLKRNTIKDLDILQQHHVEYMKKKRQVISQKKREFVRRMMLSLMVSDVICSLSRIMFVVWWWICTQAAPNEMFNHFTGPVQNFGTNSSQIITNGSISLTSFISPPLSKVITIHFNTNGKEKNNGKGKDKKPVIDKKNGGSKNGSIIEYLSDPFGETNKFNKKQMALIEPPSFYSVFRIDGNDSMNGTMFYSYFEMKTAPQLFLGFLANVNYASCLSTASWVAIVAFSVLATTRQVSWDDEMQEESDDESKKVKILCIETVFHSFSWGIAFFSFFIIFLLRVVSHTTPTIDKTIINIITSILYIMWALFFTLVCY